MKKISKSTLVLIIIFVIGLSLMLYPVVSDYWNSFHQSRAIASYVETVNNMDQEEYDALLAQAPLQYYRQNSGALQSLSLVWPRQDAAASTAAIHLSRQTATGVYVSFGLSVGGDLDAETRLRDWLALLGVDGLGDWEPVDTGSYADTFALYSAKGQATAHRTAAAGWVNLQLSKGSHTF